jgi:L-ribulose-5-phosphate 3-epimerase
MLHNRVDRRHFLQGTCAMLAAGSLADFAIGAAPTPNGFKKAVKIGMVKVEGSLADKFKLLKKLGFDGIELDSPNNYSVEEVLAAKKESGLEVPGVVDSVHWKQRLSDPDPAVRAEGVKALEQAIRDVKAYGGTSVLLVPAKVDADATYEQCWERSQAEIKKVIPLAEELGIDILMENVWNDFLTDAKETARFIDELGSERIGAYFDVGNAVRYAPPAEWIPILGHRIKKLDIKEYKLQEDKAKVYAGFSAELLEGDCNWPKVMQELAKIKFVGWGTAEIPGGGEERLAKIAQLMDKIFAS